MDSESCIITTKNRFINQSSSLHFEQKISLNGHCDGLPPRSNNSQQNGANDQKRWSTSYSASTGVSDSTTTASPQQFDQDDCNSKDSKLPSYVGISCTISGYSSYSRYCSSIRGSYSRGSSPIMRNYEVIDGPNVVQHHHHFHQLHHNNNHLDSSSSSSQQQQQQQQQQNQFHQRQSFISPISNNDSTTNGWSREDNGFISGGLVSDHTHKNNNDLICGDLDYDDDTSGSSEKSLVQRRIESLYGSNVAEIWRDSRSKVKKVNKKKIEMINHRSPSCPPHALRSKECNKKSPAVLSHLNEKFLSKIDSDPKNNPVNGLINSLNKVLKVNGNKTTNGTQQQSTARENGFHSNKTNRHNNHEYHNYHHQNNNHNVHPHINKIRNGLKHHHQHSSDNIGFEGDEGMDQIDKVDVIQTLENHNENHREEEGTVLVKNGEMYLLKLEETINALKVEIAKTEKLLEDDSHLINEEITGNLLSSIGKGNLLISQKLNQFRELCHKNINGNHFEQFSTKNEDLDGFWEMVYIQVEDVLNNFQEIYKLKQNNWIIMTNNNESPSSKIPKIRSPRKVIAASKTSPKQSNPTTRNTARDEMRKQRLREAKLKSQSRLQEMKQLDDDVVIFVPPNNPDDLLIKNNGVMTDS